MPHSPRLLLLPLALLSACKGPAQLMGLFQKTTPHEAYARALDAAGLHEATLARRWRQAAAQALRDTLTVALPLLETGYFQPDQPTAASFRYPVQAGEQIHARLSWPAGQARPPRVFVEAFALAPGNANPELLPWVSTDTSAAGTLDLRYRATAPGSHLLRLQAELLAAGRYTLRLWREPSLGTFPVQGRTDAAVGSRWGVARDDGRRRHEGLDIFAPRGTPALAAVAGTVAAVGEDELGGLTVWLHDPATGLNLYYAHLDQQLVRAGQRVRAGDSLGLVGTTGNARTTPPHLHFGIYQPNATGKGGALDPWPFLHRPAPTPTALPAGPDRRGAWVRLSAAAGRVAGLPATLPLRVLGQRAGQQSGPQPGWLRVELPDGQRRYVAATGAAPASPLRQLRLPVAAEALAQPRADAPAVARWPIRAPIAVLGEAAGYSLLRGRNGIQGWAQL